MKKALACILILSAVALSNFGALALPKVIDSQPQVILARKAPANIKIDGDLSEWQELIPLNHELIPDWYAGNLREWTPGVPVTDKADWSGAFAFAWDENYLYFAGQVNDNVYIAGWNDDYNAPRGNKFRIYIDAKGTHDPTPSSWQYMVLVNPEGFAISPMNAGDEDKAKVPPDVKMAAKKDGANWTLEFAIPKSELKSVNLAPGSILGVEVIMDDFDSEDGGRTHCLAYFGGANHWVNAENWGEMKLVE